MAIDHLKLLINLARIDGAVGAREENYIINIGAANGINRDAIVPLLSQHHDIIVPDNLTDDQKFNYIFSLVQLMKIDERLYKEEIRYCSKVASKLGYEETVMFDLMLHVQSTMPANQLEDLKKLTAKYLNRS